MHGLQNIKDHYYVRNVSRKPLQFSIGVLEQLLGECSDQTVVWATDESVMDIGKVLLIFSLSNNTQTSAGTHQSSCKMDIGDYVLGGVKLITKL
jgi:hypothetical protein